jgi:hypothetical protein
MPLSSLILIIATVVGVTLFTVRLLLAGHPENGCSTDLGPKHSLNDRFYNKADRPAGPDAEDAALEKDPAPPRPPTFRRRVRLIRQER